ncbi:unnamed protein product [Sphagnum balticum]
MIQVVEATFYFDFYEKSCPHAEKVVKEVVLSQFKFNQGIAPGILRLFFHDCFVEGCDASLLLDPTQDNPTPEKTAILSLSLRGYEVIDIAKQKLEAACPGVVSCADILAFAARDSVKVTGGPSYKIKSGRRDGRVSCASQVPPNIPSAGPNITELIDTFAAKNLSVQEMVTLSGAHTIGRAHCKSFAPIRNYAIDAAFAKCVNKVCPTPTVNNTVSLDATTPYDFDNVYFQNLAAKKGLLPSDEILFLDPRTNMEVLRNAKHFGRWKKKFVEAMIKMGTTDLKLGTQGEIRNNCRKINS